MGWGSALSRMEANISSPTWWPSQPEEHTVVSSVILRPLWYKTPDHVYIGMPGYAGQTEGPFGKPWHLLRDPRGWQTAYAEYLEMRINTDDQFRSAVMSLHGKVLICFCKGKGGILNRPCHGDLLARTAEHLWHTNHLE